VVIFAFEDLLPERVRIAVASRAVTWAGSIVDIKSLAKQARQKGVGSLTANREENRSAKCWRNPTLTSVTEPQAESIVADAYCVLYTVRSSDETHVFELILR
jgi:hypothetical protein